MSIYFSATDLLQPPTERAAFSDRQAYVCAELSRLAYFRFEGGHSLEQALEVARSVFANDPRLPELEKQLSLILYPLGNAADGSQALASILDAAGFKLLETFAAAGTQAFLCTRQLKHPSEGVKTLGYLVFRGTEPTEFADIQSDVRAALRKVTTCEGDEVEMHCGYLDAFAIIRDDIEIALKAATIDQLILTGHSLGGALAVVATRLMPSNSIGACYTFGAPPVGTIEVQNTLKTPIYEIINEIDIVPRLPNPWISKVAVIGLRLFRIVCKSVTGLNLLLLKGNWDTRLEFFIESMTRYRHSGYISYLVGSGADAHLRFNVDSMDRLKWWWCAMWKRAVQGFKEMVGDHSIEVYVEKLRTHARRRN